MFAFTQPLLQRARRRTHFGCMMGKLDSCRGMNYKIIGNNNVYDDSIDSAVDERDFIATAKRTAAVDKPSFTRRTCFPGRDQISITFGH